MSAERNRFIALLDEATAQGSRIPFWWRDDDAETRTPALDRLLALRARHEMPLALAVVPAGATTGLAQRLASEGAVSVLQHGWQHRNYAPDEEKKAELGPHRPVALVIEELKRGFERLSALFPKKMLPVLVPPWNRISDEVSDHRGEAGLVGLSTFGSAPAGGASWVNPHLDIFEWRPIRRPVTPEHAYAVLSTELERRLTGDPEPIGIMTHHLVHEDASWALLDDILALTAKHRAVDWKPVATLFNLSNRG